jgi:CBS-domain-containing membrane protein
MNSALERLLTLRVADVMTGNVVRIPAHETMAGAARMMHAHDISGAPVVDEEGRCVGMLSGADFVGREQAASIGAESLRGRAEHVLVRKRPGEPYHISDVPEDLVRNHMATAVQTIRPEASLLEAARTMCTAHIHRLVVLDERVHPIGIVSSLDVAAALVTAMEE